MSQNDETELQIINISIIVPSLDHTCINHGLHSHHSSHTSTASSTNVLALGTGVLQSLTHLLSAKMPANFLFLTSRDDPSLLKQWVHLLLQKMMQQNRSYIAKSVNKRNLAVK